MGKTAIERLARYTQNLCDKCSVDPEEKATHRKQRCCDKLFCTAVRDQLPAGVQYDWDGSRDVPYLREGGCVVKPEHRPFCVGYLCPGWSSNQAAWKKYRRLCSKAGLPTARTQ